RSTTPSTARSPSSTSSWPSLPLGRRSRSPSRGRARSQRYARPSGPRTPPTQRPGRSAAISHSRCRTTSSTAPTQRSRPRARRRSGSRTMSSSDLPDSVARNIRDWTKANADYTDAKAAESWAAEEITWGVFGVPEAEIGALGDVAGKDVVELGCGTAYYSAWLAKRGARAVGVDPTPAQLATARRLQAATGIHFPLVEAPAEAVPLPDSSF